MRSLQGTASRRFRVCSVLLFIAAILGCEYITGPDDDTADAEPPRQLVIEGDPHVATHYALQVTPAAPADSFVLIRVTSPDSTFAINWWPTEILVETDGGYREIMHLRPRRCMEPANAGGGFPYNFQWWTCDQVGIVTGVVLSPERLRAIMDVAGGDTVYTRVLQSMPGAVYVFRVGIGRRHVDATAARLAQVPEVKEAFRMSEDPICLLSDAVPPPPCEPWWLDVRRPYVLDRATAAGDTIPLQRGGWIRATYTQPDGSTRITTVIVPH